MSHPWDEDWECENGRLMVPEDDVPSRAADARRVQLASAAPDMYRALSLIVRQAQSRGIRGEDFQVFQFALDAMKKARGEYGDF